jgi:putative membrane protein
MRLFIPPYTTPAAVTIAFAFLHHLAAFTLVAALAAQMVLLRGDVTVQGARRLRTIDALYGASAGILLVVGLLRVFYFEKGASYYFQSVPFIAKLALFVAVALLSIYPTLTFRRWNRQGTPAAESVRTVRKVVHAQLGGVVLILLFAAMMARGVGFLG